MLHIIVHLALCATAAVDITLLECWRQQLCYLCSWQL
jgi:hypothetical protein